jgi:hypothetical protein
MTPLLLLSGLAVAKRSVDRAVRRSLQSVATYTLLVSFGVCAVGFLTAGCFLYIMSVWGAVTGSMLIAAAFTLLFCVTFIAIRLLNTRRISSQIPPLSTLPADVVIASDRREPSSSMIAVGLLAAAGYLIGRFMVQRR